MNILFLYTELASYFLAGVKELTKNGHSVHIVRWPVNKEAPFQFDFPEGATVYERNHYNKEELVELAKSIQPDVIISSGWVDKGYLSVCRYFKGRIPTVMSMDNQWHGTLRQQLMRLAAPWLLHPAYSHAWVPGAPQKKYARKLGFKKQHIHEGFYSADVKLFSSSATDRTEATSYPRKLVYVGRYVRQKGLDLLFPAFMELQAESPNEWELWCAGTGELFEQRPVVHEMAAAGFPMICSTAIGGATRFLEEGKNGFLFENEDKESLKNALRQIMSLSDKELRAMAGHSHQLGISYDPEMWAGKVIRRVGD
jgi:glycosyltransferase involved in cell wall biosynthesis